MRIIPSLLVGSTALTTVESRINRISDDIKDKQSKPSAASMFTIDSPDSLDNARSSHVNEERAPDWSNSLTEVDEIADREPGLPGVPKALPFRFQEPNAIDSDLENLFDDIDVPTTPKNRTFAGAGSKRNAVTPLSADNPRPSWNFRGHVLSSSPSEIARTKHRSQNLSSSDKSSDEDYHPGVANVLRG